MYTHNSHIDITRLGMKGWHVLQRPQHWRPQYGTYHKLPSLELERPGTKRNKLCQYEDKILTTLGHLTIQDLQHILRSIWEKQYAFLLYTLLQLDRQAIERQPLNNPLNLMTGLSGLHQKGWYQTLQVHWQLPIMTILKACCLEWRPRTFKARNWWVK